MVLFIAVPTTINRPAIDNRNIFSVMVQSIYEMDAPTNLFPSIHYLESWICFRGTICHKSFSGGYKAGMFLMTILVFMSTVLIKQHVIIDIVGAIVVAEISFVTVRKIKGIRIRDR